MKLPTGIYNQSLTIRNWLIKKDPVYIQRVHVHVYVHAVTHVQHFESTLKNTSNTMLDTYHYKSFMFYVPALNTEGKRSRPSRTSAHVPVTHSTHSVNKYNHTLQEARDERSQRSLPSQLRRSYRIPFNMDSPCCVLVEACSLYLVSSASLLL